MEQTDYFTQMSREDPVRYGAIMLIVYVSRFMFWAIILSFLVVLSKIVSHDSGFNKYPRRRR